MKVLCLGAYGKKLEQYMHLQGDEAVFVEDAIIPGSKLLKDVDILVSFGYKYLLPSQILHQFPKRAINLHISFLPWNRGADPNLWSFLEDTPKGASIHCLSQRLDAGDILSQEEVNFGAMETLASSYETLMWTVMKLFERDWPEIKKGLKKSIVQPEGGTFHKKKDAEVYRHLLRKGWETPVSELIGKALRKKVNQI